MSILIIAVLVGIAFTYFAVQNATGVILQLGSYSFGPLPLYMIALGALLLGLILSWIIHLIQSASAAILISGKEHQIQDNQKTLNQLELRIHDLEAENARLRALNQTKGGEHVTEKETVVETKPNWRNRLKLSF